MSAPPPFLPSIAQKGEGKDESALLKVDRLAREEGEEEEEEAAAAREKKEDRETTKRRMRQIAKMLTTTQVINGKDGKIGSSLDAPAYRDVGN